MASPSDLIGECSNEPGLPSPIRRLPLLGHQLIDGEAQSCERWFIVGAEREGEDAKLTDVDPRRFGHTLPDHVPENGQRAAVFFSLDSRRATNAGVAERFQDQLPSVVRS